MLRAGPADARAILACTRELQVRGGVALERQKANANEGGNMIIHYGRHLPDEVVLTERGLPRLRASP